MTTTTSTTRAAAPARRPPPLLAMTLVEARLYLREPMAVFFGLVFPALLLVVLSSVLPGFRDPDPELGGLRGVDVYTPVAIALAIATVALVTFSSVLAIYREKGVLRRLATTPVGPGRVLLANLITQGAVLLAASLLTVVAARLIFDVALPSSWTGALLAVVLGATSMGAVGMLVAALAPTARAASGLGTLVYFPMMFFGGVWTPGPTMPDVAQRIADLTPLGAASAALQDAWAGTFPSPLHLGVTVAWTVVCAMIAQRFFRWE